MPPQALWVLKRASGGTLGAVKRLRRHVGHSNVPPEALWARNSASGCTFGAEKCLRRHVGHSKGVSGGTWALKSASGGAFGHSTVPPEAPLNPNPYTLNLEPTASASHRRKWVLNFEKTSIDQP